MRSRPQRNAVHRHTVDRHLVETVVRAAGLVRRVSRPDLLLVAALLHDIGKVRGAHDHSLDRGRPRPAASRRAGAFAPDVEVLVTLVREHLTLIELATRRDHQDPATVDAAVASVGGDREVFEMLLALTEADASAAGPLAWTDWRATLLDQLAVAVRDRLDAPAGGLARRRAAAAEADALDRDLVAAVRAGEPQVRVIATGGSHRLDITDLDRVGLFADTAGLLAAEGHTVRTAILRTVEGIAVNEWHVESPSGAVPTPHASAAAWPGSAGDRGRSRPSTGAAHVARPSGQGDLGAPGRRAPRRPGREQRRDRARGARPGPPGPAPRAGRRASPAPGSRCARRTSRRMPGRPSTPSTSPAPTGCRCRRRPRRPGREPGHRHLRRRLTPRLPRQRHRPPPARVNPRSGSGGAGRAHGRWASPAPLALSSVHQPLRPPDRDLQEPPHQGRLSESDVNRTIRDIRLALLDADVALPVVKEFTHAVRERALGAEVNEALNPAQQVVKIVNEELVGDPRRGDPQHPLREAAADGHHARRPPGVRQDHPRRQARPLAAGPGPHPLLVAADLQRPNAVTQLEVVGERAGVPVFAPERGNVFGHDVVTADR